MSLPHCLGSLSGGDSASHSRPPIHDSMICCQLSPVAHLQADHTRDTDGLTENDGHEIDGHEIGGQDIYRLKIDYITMQCAILFKTMA